MAVAALMAACLIAGRLVGGTWARGWALAGLVWVAVLGLVAGAPGQAAALGIGGDWRAWAAGGALVALVLAYRAALGAMRGRAAALARGLPGAIAAAAEPVPGSAAAPSALGAAPPPGTLSDAELDRYARHIVLRELGGPGQAALRRARVLVVGAGGLGAPACLYLAAAGVGRITIADDDRVSLANLQRQVIYRSSDDGRPKVEAARAAMLALNPHVEVRALARRVTAADVALVAGHDLVLDGTDSFAARAGVNAACVAAGVPLVAGAIAQWEGQLTIWDPARGAPCMACLFPDPPAPGLAPPCAEAGVAGPLPGIIGSMMALEAVKLIARAGAALRGRMLILDGLYGENRVVAIARRPDCPVYEHGHAPS